MTASLNERERQVLEAVIETYVETAEPAGRRTVSKRFGLALSPASIRNTMSDLEEKGYLYHPHTSAGRIPTDLAYRVYVNSLMRLPPVTASESHQIREGLGEHKAGGQILERAAQVLGVLTKELGVAVGPTLDAAVLERLGLLLASLGRGVAGVPPQNGGGRAIFVEVPARLAPEAVAQVGVVLNERLAGLTLREIRGTLPERLRDATPDADSSELLNIFIQEADELFDMPTAGNAGVGVVLGSAQLLAGQPEFATKERLQGLMEVTERRDLLREALAQRLGQGLTITIGSEHLDPKLARFTLVTASYRLGALAGVIGVMGPTRMPYDKIVALVDHTSRLVGELLEGRTTITPCSESSATRTKPRSKRRTAASRCSTIPIVWARTRSRRRKRSSRRSRRRTRSCGIPRSAPRTTAMVRPACAAERGRGRETTGSRTSTCRKPSTCSCATSAGWAASTRCLAAGGAGRSSTAARI